MKKVTVFVLALISFVVISIFMASVFVAPDSSEDELKKVFDELSIRVAKIHKTSHQRIHVEANVIKFSQYPMIASRNEYLLFRCRGDHILVEHYVFDKGKTFRIFKNALDFRRKFESLIKDLELNKYLDLKNYYPNFLKWENLRLMIHIHLHGVSRIEEKLKLEP